MVIGSFDFVGVSGGDIEAEADPVLLIDVDGPLTLTIPPSLCSQFPGGVASSSMLSTRSSCASLTCARRRAFSDTALDRFPSKSRCVSLSSKLLITVQRVCHAPNDISTLRNALVTR